MVLLDERERRRREYFLGIALVSSHEKKIIIYLSVLLFLLTSRFTLLGTTQIHHQLND